MSDTIKDSEIMYPIKREKVRPLLDVLTEKFARSMRLPENMVRIMKRDMANEKFPSLLDIAGVQPMPVSTASIFTLKYQYSEDYVHVQNYDKAMEGV